MVTLQYKPKYLPQVSAPYIYVLNRLKENGIKYKVGRTDPTKILPSQGLVSLEKISDIDFNNIKPIWVSQDYHVLDGHHRYGSAIAHKTKLPYIQIMLPSLDASRMLNKIQDIFEYETNQKIEELTHTDHINNLNEPEMVDFLSAIEMEVKDGQQVIHSGVENSLKKRRKIYGYRKNPINEKSSIGNFFAVKPIDGYTKYEIEFDNLLDTDEIGLHFYDNPLQVLAKAWFPNVIFEDIAKKYKLKPEYLINRAIVEKANKMGYDGIKYGDVIIQGLK